MKYEEERVPQKLDHLLEKKDFTDYQERISQTIKALELSLFELKKVVDFQKKQILDVITRVSSLEVFRIEINPKLLKLADRIQTIEPTIDELLTRINRVEKVWISMVCKCLATFLWATVRDQCAGATIGE